MILHQIWSYVKYKKLLGYRYEKYWTDRAKKYGYDMRYCGTNTKTSVENLIDYERDSHKITNLIKPGSTVLDIGCGNMYYLGILHHDIKSYHGIDIVTQDIERKFYNCPVQFTKFDITDWRFSLGGDTYDYILCLDVMQHVTRKKHFHNALKYLIYLRFG